MKRATGGQTSTALLRGHKRICVHIIITSSMEVIFSPVSVEWFVRLLAGLLKRL